MWKDKNLVYNVSLPCLNYCKRVDSNLIFHVCSQSWNELLFVIWFWRLDYKIRCYLLQVCWLKIEMYQEFAKILWFKLSLFSDGVLLKRMVQGWQLLSLSCMGVVAGNGRKHSEGEESSTPSLNSPPTLATMSVWLQSMIMGRGKICKVLCRLQWYAYENKKGYYSLLVISEYILFFTFCLPNSFPCSDFSPEAVAFTSGVAPLQPSPPNLEQACINSLSLGWSKQPLEETFTLQMEDSLNGYGFRPVYNGSDTKYECQGLRRNADYKFRVMAKQLYFIDSQKVKEWQYTYKIMI